MLEMKNVTKTFGNFKALDDLTLTVPSGRVYGLVGPNGAGKSTAIRHLTGVYRPDSGAVTMDGQPIYENPAVKATIGYIPDEIFYYPSATLEDMRRFYRGIYPTFDDALFDKLYDVFQLPKRTPIRRFSKAESSLMGGLILNHCQSETDQGILRRFAALTGTQVVLSLPQCREIPVADCRRQLVVETFPDCEAAKALRRFADHLEQTAPAPLPAPLDEEDMERFGQWASEVREAAL